MQEIASLAHNRCQFGDCLLADHRKDRHRQSVQRFFRKACKACALLANSQRGLRRRKVEIRSQKVRVDGGEIGTNKEEIERNISPDNRLIANMGLGRGAARADQEITFLDGHRTPNRRRFASCQNRHSTRPQLYKIGLPHAARLSVGAVAKRDPRNHLCYVLQLEHTSSYP